MSKDLKQENRRLKEENQLLKETMGKMIDTWNNITEGEVTARCQFCNRPYPVYPKIVGDQNACERCKRRARSK